MQLHSKSTFHVIEYQIKILIVREINPLLTNTMIFSNNQCLDLMFNDMESELYLNDMKNLCDKQEHTPLAALIALLSATDCTISMEPKVRTQA